MPRISFFVRHRRRVRVRRQLQHSRALSGAEACQQLNRSVRKLQGVTMHIGSARIYLPETGYGAGDSAPKPPRKWAPVFGLSIKSELRTGPQAHRHSWLANTCETDGDRVGKFGRYQYISDRSRPRCDVMQAVIAHRIISFFATTDECHAAARVVVRPGHRRTEIAVRRLPDHALIERCLRQLAGSKAENRPAPACRTRQQKARLAAGPKQ